MNLPYSFHYAKLARDLSSHHKPMGAAIFRHGRAVALGCNIQKSHAQFPNLYSVHAEIKAILSAQTDLAGCDLYVYRELRDGQPALAKPCPTCMQLIIESKIRRVFYTTALGYQVITL